MRPRRTILLVLLLCAGSIQAQIITVVEAQTRIPLKQVNIYTTKRPFIFAATGSRGKADISRFQGRSDIRLELIGYKAASYTYRQLADAEGAIALQRTPLQMEQIVVSASRWQRRQEHIPMKVSLITPLVQRFQQPRTTADLLTFSGDVFVQKSQLGGGSPMLRGFAANRILISVDGIRMNTSIFRSGNVQNIISLDPFALEQTEVLFGPGSVLYGSDAVGGVLSFTTLQPLFSLVNAPSVTGNAAVRTNSANRERTGHADVRIGFARCAFVTSITRTEFDDQRMGTYGPDEYLRPAYAVRENGSDVIKINEDPLIQAGTGYSQWNILQKIAYKLEAGWDLTWTSNLSESSDIPRYDRLIMTDSEGDLTYGDWYYGPQKWYAHSLSVSNDNGLFFYDQLKFIASWQFFEESRHSRKFGNPVISRRTERNRVLSVNLDLQKHIAGGRQVFYGFEAILDQVRSTAFAEHLDNGTKTPISTRYPDGSGWNSWAAYIQYNRELSPGLSFQSSLRGNLVRISAEFDTTRFPYPFTSTRLETGALTGSAGMTWRPGEKNELRLNLSSGFRAPNIDDLGKVFDSEPGSLIVPNPDLRPEYAWNIEAGWTAALTKRLRFDVTAYATLLDGAMVRRCTTINGRDSIVYDGTMSGVQHLANAAEARVWGIQAGLDAQAGSGFSFRARFNYQQGEEIDGGEASPLRHAVPWFGLSALTWESGRLKVETTAFFSGAFLWDQLAMPERNKPYLYALDRHGRPWSPGWYSLGITARYRISEAAAVTAGLENITDRRYRTYSSGIAAPGRSGTLTLTAGF